MKAAEFDKKFDMQVDAGESVLKDLNLTSARRPNLAQHRVNVDLTVWMVDSLDREARRLGVTRQSVIKMWLAQRLEQEIVPSAQ